MNITKEVAQRSTCIRAKVGAIIVRDDQIVATGYAGAPRGTKDCSEHNNCYRQEQNIESGTRYEMCRSVHSEQNAIINAARAGVSVLGGTMYLYMERGGVVVDTGACLLCKKMIINAGIKYLTSRRADFGVMENVWRRETIENWVDHWARTDILEQVNC